MNINGTNLSGATTVTFNGTAASFTVQSATNITATVPAGATTGKVSVTTDTGTATSTGNFSVTSGSVTLDLAIDGMYITQASQEYPNPTIPLVKDRSAWIRVFVTANESNSVTPQVQVQFTNGNTTHTTIINAPGASVPTNANPNVDAAWDASVPASWIQDGTQVVATVDPSGVVPEADKTNNTATQTLDVRTLLPWKITLIPIAMKNGNTGTVLTSTRTLDNWVDFARRLYPVPDAVDVALGSTLNVTDVNSLNSDGTGWTQVLQELATKRTADGVNDRYYFGVVHVTYSSGVAGMGYVGAPEAIGWDYSSGPSVLAHEEGHNFGRKHTPCGNPADIDPNYPYSSGIIGVPGWDVFASSNNLETKNRTDIMGYCSNQWVSDYTYAHVLTFRANSAMGMVQSDVRVEGEEGLLVWGEIENDHVVLEPAFRVPVKTPAAQYGPYQLEARDATGQVLASMSFDATPIADLPNRNVQGFSFVVPIASDKIGSVHSLHVVKNGQEVTQTVRAGMGVQVLRQQRQQAFTAQDLPGGHTQFSWNAQQYPMVLLKDAKTGEVRGFLRGGAADIVDAPEEMELQFSDGVSSEKIVRQRTRP